MTNVNSQSINWLWLVAWRNVSRKMLMTHQSYINLDPAVIQLLLSPNSNIVIIPLSLLLFWHPVDELQPIQIYSDWNDCFPKAWDRWNLLFIEFQTSLICILKPAEAQPPLRIDSLSSEKWMSTWMQLMQMFIFLLAIGLLVRPQWIALIAQPLFQSE